MKISYKQLKEQDPINRNRNNDRWSVKTGDNLKKKRKILIVVKKPAKINTKWEKYGWLGNSKL